MALPARSRVHIRPLRPGERAAVETVFAGMSPGSRYLRFHCGMPALPGPVRRGLVAVDGHRHVALVAETARAREPVGIARFVATAADRAELAIEVVDAWHGRGVGRSLLEELHGRARRLGYRELTALVRPENRAVLRLLHRVFPGIRTTVQDGVLELTCPVDPACVELTLAHLLGEEVAV